MCVYIYINIPKNNIKSVSYILSPVYPSYSLYCRNKSPCPHHTPIKLSCGWETLFVALTGSPWIRTPTFGKKLWFPEDFPLKKKTTHEIPDDIPLSSYYSHTTPIRNTNFTGSFWAFPRRWSRWSLSQGSDQ